MPLQVSSLRRPVWAGLICPDMRCAGEGLQKQNLVDRYYGRKRSVAKKDAAAGSGDKGHEGRRRPECGKWGDPHRSAGPGHDAPQTTLLYLGLTDSTTVGDVQTATVSNCHS